MNSSSIIDYRDVLNYIFTFINVTSDWLNIKLTCKLFNQLTFHIFNPSIDDNYAFIYSIRNYLFESIKWLLKHPKIDPTINDNFALRHAYTNKYSEIVKLLLYDSRSDPSIDNNNI